MKKFYFAVLAACFAAQFTMAQDYLWPLTSDLKDTKQGLTGTNHGVTFGKDPVRGDVAKFDGTAWASLPSFMNAMASEMTVSVWMKMDEVITWARPYAFGSGTSEALMFVPKNDFADPVKGWSTFTVTGSSRWDAHVDTALVHLEAGKWYHIVHVIKQDSIIGYINNQRVVEELSWRDLTSTPLDDSNNMLGSDFWNDPLFVGAMSNLQVIGHGLSTAEVNTLYNSTLITPNAVPSVSANKPSVYVVDKSIKIELKQAGQNAMVKVYNTTGNLIAQDDASNIGNQEFQTGIYMVQIAGDAINFTTKIVIR